MRNPFRHGQDAHAPFYHGQDAHAPFFTGRGARVPVRGFTLIELLIVVAILSILAVIGAVNYRLAVRRADRVACASSLKALVPALWAYKTDWNHYPLADGLAGEEPSPGRTEVGNGPAANGSWDGAPRILVTLRYLSSDQALFCPALAKRYPHKKQSFRYAYNASAADTGGFSGAPNHLDRDAHEIWVCRCLWVPSEYSFRPSERIEFPHGDEQDCENVLLNSGAVVLRPGGEDFKRTYSIR
jgi:prepilin-type N-terminal cleavage/methylation domain-containing protein